MYHLITSPVYIITYLTSAIMQIKRNYIDRPNCQRTTYSSSTLHHVLLLVDDVFANHLTWLMSPWKYFGNELTEQNQPSSGS